MNLLFVNKDGTYIVMHECYTVVVCGVLGSYIKHHGKTVRFDTTFDFSNS